MLSVIKNANHRYCRCLAGSAIQNLGYTSSGTCLDFVYGNTNARYSWAVEIYNGMEGKGYAKKDGKHTRHHKKSKRRSNYHSFLETELSISPLSHSHSHSHEHSSFYSPNPTNMQPITVPLTEAQTSLIQISSERRFQRSHSIPHSNSRFPPVTRRNFKFRRQYRCMSIFNPVTPKKYSQTISHWNRAFFYMFDEILDKMGDPN
jgi:hypothetical protein